MRISHRWKRSVAVGVLAAGALLAPVATTTAGARPPCCGVDDLATYWSTPDFETGTIVGQYDEGYDCGPYSWGVQTPYVSYSYRYCATSTG
jgi:hypothetical protein